MSIKEAIRKYHGPRDERIEAEMNRIYKIGFLILTFGYIVDLYYNGMRAQVAMIHDVNSSVNVFEYVDPFMLALFLIAMIVCCILMCRKGFVDTGRFGETDTFPTGYFALWSLGAAVLAGLLAALMRALAEYQMVGVQGIFWPVDIAVGIGTAVMVFVLTYLAYYISFRAAKRRRKTLTAVFDEES